MLGSGVASADNRSNPFRNLDPVLDRFRALRECCVADQSCHNFVVPEETRAI